MLVKLTFVKRLVRGGILFRQDRIYKLEDDRALELCGVTSNDMPIFQIVDPSQVNPEQTIVDMTGGRAEAEDDEPEIEETADEMEARLQTEHAENMKKLAAKKASEKKAAKAPAKSTKLATGKKKVVAAPASDVEMV